ncbi:UNVERIFIED_CONTAM: hypothetical protein FKN15_023904 [Acipenser sinensis]
MAELRLGEICPQSKPEEEMQLQIALAESTEEQEQQMVPSPSPLSTTKNHTLYPAPLTLLPPGTALETGALSPTLPPLQLPGASSQISCISSVCLFPGSQSRSLAPCGSQFGCSCAQATPIESFFSTAGSGLVSLDAMATTERKSSPFQTGAPRSLFPDLSMAPASCISSVRLFPGSQSRSFAPCGSQFGCSCAQATPTESFLGTAGSGLVSLDAVATTERISSPFQTGVSLTPPFKGALTIFKIHSLTVCLFPGSQSRSLAPCGSQFGCSCAQATPIESFFSTAGSGLVSLDAMATTERISSPFQTGVSLAPPFKGALTIFKIHSLTSY